MIQTLFTIEFNELFYGIMRIILKKSIHQSLILIGNLQIFIIGLRSDTLGIHKFRIEICIACLSVLLNVTTCNGDFGRSRILRPHLVYLGDQFGTGESGVHGVCFEQCNYGMDWGACQPPD